MLSGESRYVNVDGITTHYLVAGEGPPLILLHGLGASVITWRDNIGPLSQAFSVYAVDLHGHGDTDKPDLDYSMETVLSFFILFLDTLGIERCSLIGNSTGGYLALRMALDYSERVEKLVLVDSAGLGREVSLYIRLASIPLLGNLLESHRVGRTKFMLRNVFYDERFATDGLIEELYRSRRMPGAKEAVARATRNGATPWGLRKSMILLHNLKDLSVPHLLVWGAQDQIVPVVHAYNAIRQAPGAQIKVFEECGHWPHMEKAQEFNSLVLNFLGSDH